MIFYIPYLNPIRFTGGAGDKFDTLLMVDLINKYQEERCYFQKWNTGDSTKMQILSDWEFTFKVYNLDNVEIEEIVPSVFVETIAEKTFKAYEVALSFDVPGSYYAVIEYDGNKQISEPWHVGNYEESTMLFKYKNSENNFSVFFDQGFEFFFRVEGLVANFEPKSDDVIYNDQTKNSRLLNAVPWRSFTMFVGNEGGIPDWVADKVNRIMACDVVHIDSETFDGYISKVDGAEWEVVRPSEQPFSGVRTEIMPVENSLLERLKREDGGGGTGLNYTIVQKIDNYYDVSGVLPITGTFGKYRLLEKICIEKNLADPSFNLKVGTTSGGSEIAEVEIVDGDSTVTLEKLFLADTNIYLSGFALELPFISVIYKNLIENPAGTGVPASGDIPLGAVLIYSPLVGRALTDDFSVVTGLGLEGGAWYGWAICNGLNGTPDISDKFVLGFSNGENTDGQTGGTKEETLTEAQIPSHSHGYKNAVGSAYKRGNTGTRFFDNGNNTVKQTELSGGGEAHNNMPPFIVKAYVQKIF